MIRRHVDILVEQGTCNFSYVSMFKETRQAPRPLHYSIYESNTNGGCQILNVIVLRWPCWHTTSSHEDSMLNNCNLTMGFDSPWQLIVIQAIAVAQLQHCAIRRPTAPSVKSWLNSKQLWTAHESIIADQDTYISCKDLGQTLQACEYQWGSLTQHAHDNQYCLQQKLHPCGLLKKAHIGQVPLYGNLFQTPEVCANRQLKITLSPLETKGCELCAIAQDVWQLLDPTRFSETSQLRQQTQFLKHQVVIISSFADLCWCNCNSSHDLGSQPGGALPIF